MEHWPMKAIVKLDFIWKIKYYDSIVDDTNVIKNQ